MFLIPSSYFFLATFNKSFLLTITSLIKRSVIFSSLIALSRGNFSDIYVAAKPATEAPVIFAAYIAKDVSIEQQSNTARRE